MDFSRFPDSAPADITPYARKCPRVAVIILRLSVTFFCAVMQVLPIRLSWTFLTTLFFTNEKNRTILHDTGALFQKRADFYLLFYKDVCIIY